MQCLGTYFKKGGMIEDCKIRNVEERINRENIPLCWNTKIHAVAHYMTYIQGRQNPMRLIQKTRKRRPFPQFC